MLSWELFPNRYRLQAVLLSGRMYVTLAKRLPIFISLELQAQYLHQEKIIFFQKALRVDETSELGQRNPALFLPLGGSRGGGGNSVLPATHSIVPHEARTSCMAGILREGEVFKELR